MLQIFIDGAVGPEPKELKTLQLIAEFEDLKVAEISISTEKFTFVNDGATYFNNFLENAENGSEGVYFGIPCELKKDGVTFFSCYIDLTDSANFSNEKVEVKIRKTKGVDWFQKIGDSFGFDYLYFLGKITDDDFVKVPYLVVDEDDTKDAMMFIITGYLIVREIIGAIRDIVNVISLIGGYLSIIAGVLQLIFLIAYLIVLIIALIKIIIKQFNLLIRMIYYHYGISYYKLLQVGFEHSDKDLIFQSSLFDSTPTYNSLSSAIWNDLYIVPQKTQQGFLKNGKTTGHTGLPTGTFGDFVRATQDMFNAKLFFSGNTVRIEREDYGSTPETIVLKDIKTRRSFGINANEIFSNYLLQFQIDLSDKNTVAEYSGTNCKNVISHKVDYPDRPNLLQNLKIVNIPFALAKAKRTLTKFEKEMVKFLKAIEKVLKPLFAVIDKVLGLVAKAVQFMNKIIKAINTLGLKLKYLKEPTLNLSKKSLADAITDRVGVMKLTSHTFTVPKLVLLKGDGWKMKIAPDNETRLSAENLYNKYHYLQSFVPSNEKPTGNQARIYTQIEDGFDSTKWQLAIGDNSQGKAKVFAPNGNTAEILNLKWQPHNNYAEIKYKEFSIFDTNLKEDLLINTGL